MAPPINFANCVWGNYPYNTAKPNIYPFQTSSYVGYAKSVLRCKTGWALAKDNVFDGAMYNAVRAMEALFGRPVNGAIEGADWECVDFLATH